jgi:HD-GYP domain-containing protein (c-di-GMP phosphodiesterase class II)
MQSIKTSKELIILTIGSITLITIALFLFFSLKMVGKKADEILKQETQIETLSTKNNIAAFLENNKKIMDRSFISASANQHLLKYEVEQYVSLIDKNSLQSIYFINNDGILFLYPSISKRSLPLETINNSKLLMQNIKKAKKARKSQYFNCTIYNKVFQKIPAVMLIKPVFNTKDTYIGSITSILDIQKKLDNIFSYLNDYSSTITINKDDKNCTYSPLNIDNCLLYIAVKHNSASQKALLSSIHDVMLNILFVIIIAFVLLIFTSIVIIKKSKKELLQRKLLKQLNNRIQMMYENVKIQDELLSDNIIKKILTMSNKVFEADLSGIFLKSSNTNYIFDGHSIKEQDYLSMEGSVSSYTWQKNEDTMINDIENASFVSNTVKKMANIQSSMCAIIGFKGHRYGVICVGKSKKNGFRNEDFNFLKLIAHNMASNIYHSSLSKNITEILLNSIEARDSYTEGHSRRVGEYAKFIAKILGYDEKFQNDILTAGLFHDVGKVGIPDIILLKPTRLSPNEYEIMKMHSIFSYEILKNAEILKDVLSGIRAHHERWDGKGYPDGLKENNIPLTARILAIADSFDAITTHRPYKNAMTINQTKQELIDNAGTQFDPEIIEKILPHIEEMYNLAKTLTNNKKYSFPKLVEDARKNIFYTDWFTGLMNMDYFEEIVNRLIQKNVEFFICRIDIVDFYTIKYKFGRKKAQENILIISNILKKYVSTEISRTFEDVFTFIVRGSDEERMLSLTKEIILSIESKINHKIRFSFVSHPKHAGNINELIYMLDVKHREAGYRD